MKWYLCQYCQCIVATGLCLGKCPVMADCVFRLGGAAAKAWNVKSLQMMRCREARIARPAWSYHCSRKLNMNDLVKSSLMK